MISGRRWSGAGSLALAFVVGLSALCGLAGTAHADTAYRYWAYYIGAGSSWQYSGRGPASEHPQDGEVQGWRFAIQADRSGGSVPRATPNFGTLCASTAPQAGRIRVGIVLDFGVATDAPPGDRPPATVVTGCVRVAAGASGIDVLDAAVGASKVRIGNGLICGIDGYPTTECAAAVEPPTPVATQTAPKPAPTPVPTKAPALRTPSQPPGATADTPKSTASAPALEPSRSAEPGSRPAGSPATGPTPTRSASAAPSSLEALRTSSHHVFPTGAVVGAAIVVALGVAAAVRAFGGRR